jgi:3-methyladenine DNA glycosylase AlkD
MNHFKKHHSKIVKKLQDGLSADKKTKFKDLKKYIGTQYDFIGLSVPKQRKLFQTGYEFSHLSLGEQLAIWNEIWFYTNSYEALTQCLFFVEKHLQLFNSRELWNITKKWTGKIDNWAHSDGLSAIYSHLLEIETKLVYAQFKSWNKSVKPWERRQSLVGLLEYSKKRKKVLPANKLLAMVKPLLADENYFVQKGLGWTLREIGNVYPKEAWDFLLKHYALITSVAFSPATEKLNAVKKEKIKSLRKKK